MVDLVQFQTNLQSIDTWETLKPILEKHFAEIEQFNRDQLSRGEKADGSAMPDYASDEYADFKDKYIPTYSIYPTTDLRYTGDFYEAIKASFSSYGIAIESFDSKAKELEAKYGSGIYGLTEQSQSKLVDLITGQYIEALTIAMFKN